MNMSTEERYQLAFKSKLEEKDNIIIFHLSFCLRDCVMTVKLKATFSEFHPVGPTIFKTKTKISQS